MAGPCFSTLPDELLVHVFQMLALPERGRLARSCRRLSAVMNCASLWTDVTLNLVEDGRSRIEVEERVIKRDRKMIKKYGQYFQNVSVVMKCGRVESRSLKKLTSLCQRQVIKRVTLNCDSFLSVLMNMMSEIPGYKRPHKISVHCAKKMIYRALDSIEEGFISLLGPDGHLTMELPSEIANIENNYRQELCFEFSLNFYIRLLLDRTRSKKIFTVLKKLILSNSTPDKRLTLMFPDVLSGSPPPTPTLISTFPNLQELHVNTRSLSDQLLQELSSPGRATPLRSLVIKHIKLHPIEPPDYLTLSWDMSRLVILIKWCPPFPRVSSAAWKQLANASPSLKVECCVLVDDRLPELSRIIQPETPLVKLKIYCGHAEEEKRVRLYQDLGQNHHETLEDLELTIKSVINRLHSTERMLRHWKDMVLACSRVRRLVCDLEIHPQHLREVSGSRQWRAFVVNPRRVVTIEDRGEGAGSDSTSP
ncbi:hypothetical protein ACOMHN_039277 [Nucella lapillus]